MRVCTHLVILVAAITLAATPALANDWSLENFKKGMGKSKWDGCGVGTSFTSWSRTTSPVLVAGHERKTIVKIAGDKTPRTITLKVENKACTPGAPWVAKEVIKDLKPPATWTQTFRGNETVTIGAKEHLCKKFTLTMTKGTVVEHATIWESPTDGVLRVFSKRTDSMPTVDMRASKLYVDRKFGETTLRCREFVGRVKSAGTMTLLMSTQSPQLIVSMEIDVVTDGVRMASIGKITDVAIVPFRPLATPTLPKR